MSTQRPSLVLAHYILLARSFLVIFGCAAVGWGIVEFPVFWQESSIERIADRIIAGAPFKAEILARQRSIVRKRSAYCRAVPLRSDAIIQLRMVEAASSTNDRIQFEEQLKSLGIEIRNSLSCSPADPFLWVVLFWIASTQNGPDAADVKYLRMSYQLGSKEGWIAFKRSPIALANLGMLPPDLAEAGISEFVALVRSHLFSEAADIVAAVSSPIRRLLFARLGEVKETDRKAFARLLDERGLDDISILGIEPKLQRPRR